MRDPEPTSRKRNAPPAPRPKRRRKTKAAPVEPVLSEYELGRRAKIKRNNKFLVSVGLLFPRCLSVSQKLQLWEDGVVVITTPARRRRRDRRSVDASHS